jgi:cytoskeletal protein CcmA (bactofilin family)
MFGRDKNASQQQQQQQPPSQASQVNAQSTATINIPTTAATTPKIETVIGPNCRLTGTLQSDGGIRVEGIFEGTLQTTGNLVVAESAKVIAEVQAYNVTVSGQVKGNITANKVEITESGKVWGDLNVNSMLLHEGAYLRGSTNMAGDVEPPAFEPPRIAAPKPVAVLDDGDSN